MIPELEVCTFSNTDFKEAIKYNITRIELCQNKELGGLTPSIEEIKFAASTEIPIHPIIRPRGGNFSYNKRETKSMMNTISFSKEVGCKGIVFGILDENKNIDTIKCRELIKEARGMSLTFHMAFDQVNDPFESMEKIIDLGFCRILSSGKKSSAIEGIDLISELAEKGKERISIMPGSNLRASNIKKFLDNSLINEYHSSCYINNSFSIIELQSLIKKIYS